MTRIFARTVLLTPRPDYRSNPTDPDPDVREILSRESWEFLFEWGLTSVPCPRPPMNIFSGKAS